MNKNKNEIELKELKKAVLNYRDIWGGQIHLSEEVKATTSKEELIEILDKFEDHIDDMANEAQSHLENFRSSLGLYP